MVHRRDIELSSFDERSPGRLLREARIRRGLSQEQLAIRAGTTQSAIARIERDRTSPSIKTLATLFEAMGEDLVLGTRARDWGVDLTLNRKNLECTPTERLERASGFSDLTHQVRGQISGQKAA